MAWSTPIDRVFNQKTLFYAFVGIIVATTVATLCTDSPIIGSHRQKGLNSIENDPEYWSIHSLKVWLRKHDIHFEKAELRQDLVRRVRDAMAASERREHTEFASSSSTAKKETADEIELQELGKRKAAQPQK